LNPNSLRSIVSDRLFFFFFTKLDKKRYGLTIESGITNIDIT
jgi:hypothetical protein